MSNKKTEKLSKPNNKMLADMREILNAGLNLCIEGPHGVGKTEMIKQVMDEKYGKDGWAYFSGSTMDPFIDFIGCPKEVIDDQGTAVLELVKPARFAYDNVRAIVIDEYNRAPKGVRNAVMELIQFGSINGRKYNSLEVVWTAINPSDDEYDVEALDPAQLDRFQAFIKVGGKPVKSYFSAKYGSTVAEGAIAWWNGLLPEHRISPRRLDYAIDGFLNKGIDINVFVNKNTLPHTLVANIKQGPVLEELKKLKSQTKIKKFLADENNFAGCKEYIIKPENLNNYIAFLPNEKVSMIMGGGSKEDIMFRVSQVITYAMEGDKASRTRVIDVLKSMYDSGLNKDVVDAFDKTDIIGVLSAMKNHN